MTRGSGEHIGFLGGGHMGRALVVALLRQGADPATITVGESDAARRSALATELGITTTIWLGEGCVGDDTHGHVDDIARFVAPGVVVVDEAYAQFSPWSALELVDDETPLVVTRTFSKTWSMAAARLGYLVGPRWLVADMEAVVLPYHLDAFKQFSHRAITPKRRCRRSGWRRF